MNVNDISDFTCRTVGDISSDAVEYAKTAVRLKYKTLYDAHSWRESRRIYNITLDPNLNGALFLPYDAEEVIYLKLSRDGVNYSRVDYRERDWIERTTGGRYTLPGYTSFYYRDENLAWPYINPGIFTFTTSYLAPFTVYIEGEDAQNNPISESFVLQATLASDGVTVIPGSISTANSYRVVTTLSKDGLGDLKVQDAATGVPLTMSAGMSSFVFSQFVLYPPLLWTDQTGAPIPYLVQTQVKLKADTLDNDMSVPRISHIWDALIEFTLSSLYTRAHQLSKGDAREQKAIAHIQAAVNVEKNQSENFQQVQPTIYDTGDYLNRAGYWVSSSYPFG